MADSEGPALVACVAIENHLAQGKTLAQIIREDLNLAVGLDLFLARRETAAHETGKIFGWQTADYQHGFEEGFKVGQKEIMKRTALDVGKIIHGVIPP